MRHLTNFRYYKGKKNARKLERRLAGYHYNKRTPIIVQITLDCQAA